MFLRLPSQAGNLLYPSQFPLYHTLQAFGCSLNCAPVDVRTNPAATAAVVPEPRKQSRIISPSNVETSTIISNNVSGFELDSLSSHQHSHIRAIGL
jgi:hypothetical protein